jgi:hypothetical protein
MESGISSRADFDRSAYDRVANLIDAEFIVERLRTKYGEDLKDDPERRRKTQEQLERHTAGRFVAIHQFVLTKKQRPKSAPDGQENA